MMSDDVTARQRKIRDALLIQDMDLYELKKEVLQYPDWKLKPEYRELSDDELKDEVEEVWDEYGNGGTGE